jgi:hypothetical protein
MKTTSEERVFTLWIREKHKAILDGFLNGPEWFSQIDAAFRAAGLVRVIVDLIYLLERFPNEALQELKRQRSDWPVIVPTKKLPKSSVLANALARHYFGEINACRRGELYLAGEPDEIGKLPDFTVTTARKWAAIAWRLLCDDWGGHPERNPSVAKLGEHRRKHSVTQGAQNKPTPATERANIRDGIKESVCQAFIRLAKSLDLSPTKSPKT